MRSIYLAIASLAAIAASFDCCSHSSNTKELSKAEYEKRRQRIIEFFEARQKRYDIVLTTRTKSGQIIDWIRPGQQVTDGKTATIPPQTDKSDSDMVLDSDAQLNDSARNLNRHDLPIHTEIQTDSSAKGPPGTVPIVRFDLENYFKNNPKFLPVNPEDILTKSQPPTSVLPPEP